ncbi:MAG: hydantoinase/oxoprolinase N-terminal domain-containing protein [Dongiaceae bacterium]
MHLLGFDTGGTYTDAVLFEPAAGVVVASAKSLTTKHDLSIGLRGALDAVLQTPVEDIALVSLSTTLATNAIVEGQGSPICLLLLGYEPSALDRADLRRALGHDPVCFIDGGHAATGEEQAPLDLASLEAAIERHAAGVAAFAVSGFFSVRNPAHEIAARDLIRRLTDRPVTCGHELTSKLDAPRRALTAALNARLIPQLQQLVHAVEGLLREKGIRAPLMVVKGDGSLVSAEFALTRPVETILSGPAASVVGARHLAGESDCMVADMGGTTTDIALLNGGLPVLDGEGATVAGWRTMVEAVAVHTYGLGGDSEVHRDGNGLVIGPRRLMPLSLLCRQHPAMLEVLRDQLAAERLAPGSGRFALRNRALDTGMDGLAPSQARFWALLAEGPVPMAQLVGGYAAAKAVERLVDRGLVVLSGFTPSDAAHLLGLHGAWSVDAARLGAAIWIREDEATARRPDADPETFARRVIEATVLQTGRALVDAALAAEDGTDLAAGGPLGRRMVDRAVGPAMGGGLLLDLSVRLNRPLVAIGAPVGSYYPEVARRLGTRLAIPAHAGVCNAVGAVAGGILQSVTALITAPSEGLFRVHLPVGNADFTDVERAAAHATAEASTLAASRARAAGAGDVELRRRRADKVHRDSNGLQIFIESRIDVTAFGRPRLATA